MKLFFLLLALFFCELSGQPQWNYSTDSQAVRIILDSSGCIPQYLLPSFNEMISTYNNRIRALFLSGCISSCETANLRKEIGRLTELETLDLGNNRLTRLPDELFALTKLKYLNLGGSYFDSVPSAIGNLRNLTNLRFEACPNLTRLPDAIGNLDSLVILGLMSSNLHRLPFSIGNLKQLWWLQCDGNAMDSLPMEIGGCSSLEIIELSGNNLICLPLKRFHSFLRMISGNGINDL